MRKGPVRSAFLHHKVFVAALVFLVLCACVLARQGLALELVAASRAGANAARAPKVTPKNADLPHRDSSRSWSIYHKDARSTVNIYYPQLDNPRADNELGYWADTRLRTFVTGVAVLGEGKSRYSMYVDYTLSMATPRYVSVIFRISTEIGNARPDLGMTTFTYDLKDGRQLSYSDIFSDPDGLLHFLSLYTEEELTKRLGKYERELIKRGTVPNELNFAYFAIVPGGLQLLFPPYQVASSSLGEQEVIVPLERLKSYGPNMEVWGKENINTFSLNP